MYAEAMERCRELLDLFQMVKLTYPLRQLADRVAAKFAGR
jgi:hypothetical protein